MCRVRALALGILVAGLGFFAAPAYATFHLEKVNEVMLASNAGDTHVQFVELLDKGGTEEQFTPVFAPYNLVVYDAAGNRLGAHMLDANGLRAAAGAGSPYLISTPEADAAFGVKGDEVLNVPLPPLAGQACFEANPSPSAFSCITWGTITKPVVTNSNGTGSAHGPVPPPGESDQRQADDTIVAAAPTPKAPNRSGSTSSSPAAAAFAGVTFPARTAHVDRRGRASVRVGCPAGAKGSCKGTLRLTAAKDGAALGHASFDIAAGRTATVSVKLTRTALARLKREKHLRARARATASDGSGASKRTGAALTLVRARARRAPASQPPSYY
jgi:hypothetical protein